MSRIDIGTLETRGYVNVPYPSGLRAKVHDAIAAWKDFCALPNEIKQHVSYSNEMNTREGVGYELKLKKDIADLKEDFHIRANERDFLTTEAAKIGDIATAFVSKGFELTALVAPIIEEFAKGVEARFKMKDFVQDVEKDISRVLIRFLHYFGNRSDRDELGAPHIDKGGFTLHLYESHPGLEYLSKEGTWQPMTFSEDETAIIPAIRMQYRSKNRLKATCHRIVANAESARDGRFSVVCFVGFAHTPHYDKFRIGRLQNQTAGFNYAMPFKKFAELFTSE